MKVNPKLTNALSLLDQRGLEGLIIYSSGICNILQPGYLYYFAGFKPMGPNNALVVSKTGNAILLVEPEWDSIRVSNKTWVADVRGAPDFVKSLTVAMKELKISGSPVGVIGSREMTADVYGCIETESKVVLADDIIEQLAKNKTEAEVKLIRKTAKIVDLGFKAFLKSARIGIKEYELIAEMEYAMFSAGADDNFVLISSGRHNIAMHAPNDTRLKAGDIVIAEISAVRDGQFIQECRTVVLGKPDPVLVEKYKILEQALDQAMKAMKAGVPASILSKAMNRVISDAGYAKYCYPPYMRARGHGFGAGSISPGAVIDDDTSANLEKYQVVVVHPNQYIPETGYLACGETVLVTETGIEQLASTKTKLYIKEG